VARIPRVLTGCGLVIAAGLAVLLGSPVQPAGATPDATSLYHEAMATTKSWTVHYSSESTGSGGPFLETGDAGPASGTQAILVGRGATLDSAVLIVIGDFTFLEGNELAMEDLAGLPPTQAATATGHWVMFSTNNAMFAQLVVGVRSHDVAQEIALRGPYTLDPPRKLFGHEVDAIRGTESVGGDDRAPAVLYVRASGRHLPVEEDSVGPQGKTDGDVHIVFSRWGEPVKPLAPPAGIAIGPVSSA